MEPDTLALVRFCIDMACVAAFALSGVLAARDRKAELDLFGVVVVAVVTAIGGVMSFSMSLSSGSRTPPSSTAQSSRAS